MRDTKRRQERKKRANLELARKLLREPWHPRLHGRHHVRREEWVDAIAILRDYVERDSLFLSYEQAQQWAKIRSITTCKDWLGDRNRPFFVPADPKYTYRNRWQGWGEFFDRPLNSKVRKSDREDYLSYGEARTFAISSGVTNFRTWLDARQRYSADRNNWNRLLPHSPHNFYQEWLGWSEFLDRDTDFATGKLYSDSPRWFLVVLGGDVLSPRQRYQVRHADVCRLGLTSRTSGMLAKGVISPKPWYPDIALGSIEEGTLEFVNC